MPTDDGDQLTHEDKAILKRITESVKRGDISRRDLMKLGIGGAVGGALVGSASADASTSDSDGDIGTPNDRIDVFADGVDSNSIITGQIVNNNTLVVTPQSHTVDDIFTELNNGNDVHMRAGTYTCNSNSYSISGQDVALTADPGAVIDVPDSPNKPFITWETNGDGPATDITSDALAGSESIDVSSSSEFSDGDFALIKDSADYESGKQMENGEIVHIEEVVDSTTLETSEELFLDHQTSATTLTIKPLNTVFTKAFGGMTFDLSGSGGPFSLMDVREAGPQFEILPVRIIEDSSTNFDRGIEFKRSYGSRIRGMKGPENEQASGLHNLLQIGARTKLVSASHLTNYHGNIFEQELSGKGPAIQATVSDSVAHGDGFSVNYSALETTLRNCTVFNPDSGTAGFNIKGEGAQIINPTVRGGAGIGVICAGVGERIVNPEFIDVSVAIQNGGNGDLGNQGSELVRITSPHFEDCKAINDASNAAPLYVSDVKSHHSPWEISSSTPRLRVSGGYFLGDAFGAVNGLNYGVFDNIEWDNDGNGNDFVRADGSTQKDFLKFVDCEAYNGNRFVRFDALTTGVLKNVQVPDGKSSLTQLLNTAGANGGVDRLYLSGCDGRNTSSGAFVLGDVSEVIWEDGNRDENGDDPKMHPANLEGVTGNYNGETRIHDGTNSATAGKEAGPKTWAADDSTSAWFDGDGNTFT